MLVIKKKVNNDNNKVIVAITLELMYCFTFIFPPYFHLTVCMFLSCRPFIVNTFSTGLVGVEVTSVSWLGKLTVGV